jgi:hypothetical protein
VSGNPTRGGDERGALALLRVGMRQYPNNVFIGTSAARLIAKAHGGGARGDPSERKKGEALEEAVALVERYHAIDPGNSVVLQVWATLQARRGAGAAKTARDLFKSSVEADNNHAAAWHAWAVFERSKGRTAKARRLFREARRSDPTRAATLQAWALLEAEDKKYPAARLLFGEATRLNARHAPSWQAWALMEAGLDNKGKASSLFRRGEEATRDAARGMFVRGGGSGGGGAEQEEENGSTGRLWEREGASRAEGGGGGQRGDTTTTSKGGKADGGGGGSVLEHRSALLCAWGRFEVTSGETSTRGSALSLARTLFREAVDTCPGNAHAWVSWAHAEVRVCLVQSSFGPKLNPKVVFIHPRVELVVFELDFKLFKLYTLLGILRFQIQQRTSGWALLRGLGTAGHRRGGGQHRHRASRATPRLPCRGGTVHVECSLPIA